ncbi:DUF6046 domain-containing protein [Mucilaginibacter sp. cycad4]|uniref:DUF6046 domain-containing protein n=1 Tax=Mucilaginibacter sp. cycad4 TaxID=3342096 RepID=UPI002AAB59A6|nr:DUF6046 domain-containing protein [Mucilaginibacter gossypii]WPU98381.1 DUF6046 domain-containing protein [Mucilaginibacter gossypii]
MSTINHSDTIFDIEAIFKQLYGYKPGLIPDLPPSPGERPFSISPAADNSYRAQKNHYGNALYGGQDTIGHEVFCPLTIQAGDKEYFLPYTVIGFEREKNIKETEMSEAGGTAKEIISMKDWNISVKGFVIGDLERFPGKELDDLKTLFEARGIVRLKSAYSDIFLAGNDSVLIYKLSIPEKPKVVGVRDFAMQLKSDSIFKLTIGNK